jgi:RNA polymerase sigma factor (sigma-70 family)
MDASIDDMPTLHETLGAADDYERFEAMADYRSCVLPHLAALSDREREVIEARYLATDDAPTLEQIGEGMGVSRERVRQLEGGALRELRRRAATRPSPRCQAQRKAWTNGADRG